MNIEVYSRKQELIGEGPLWSSTDQALYWLDIGGKAVHRKAPRDTQPRSWPLPEYPGCLAELTSDTIAVAMGAGIHELNLGTGHIRLLLQAPPRNAETRFNDGKVDPRGRLWVGTMQNNFGPQGGTRSVDQSIGALYCFDCDGRVRAMEERLGIANTVAWSPDQKQFYFADSLRGEIYAYDFDVDTGSIHDKRLFFAAPDIGVPDGSATDVDGCLWNARWDAGVIIRITPR